MVLNACYVLGTMLYSRNNKMRHLPLQYLPFYRGYRLVTFRVNTK